MAPAGSRARTVATLLSLALASFACSHKDTPKPASEGDAAAPRAPEAADAQADVPHDASAALPPPRDLTGKVVLHAGDSMVGGDGGLTKALGAKFKAEGAKFVRDYEVSVSIGTYARSPRLKNLLDKHKPDIVILTLGANDVFIPFPQNHIAAVEAIVKKIGDRECYWMSPPTWKPDSGIVDVIKEHSAPCKFFDSRNLTLKRAGDHIHPTEKGGADWAELFWAYFQGRGPQAPGLLDAGAPLDAGP
ncbi:MAG: SGNH/GDSL hydrolase family protein [Myxococcales bacterium]|nr:SGNH/GDSL hydrolase family protein [Myxococcales bacterium]